MRDLVDRLLQMLESGQKKFEPLCPMTPQEIEQWDILVQKRSQLKRLNCEIIALRNQFWSGVELRTQNFDDMTVDESAGMILVRKEEPQSSGKLFNDDTTEN